jgi:hypothetical protein
MRPKLAINYRRFVNYRRLTGVTPYETRIVRSRTIPYGSYHEDTLALALALISMALMTVIVVSTLVAFSIL